VFSESLRKFLAKKGFDPSMGARPMSRLIQDMIRKALADELLFGRLVAGGKVTVDLDDKEQIKLDFAEGDANPPSAPEETLEVE
jgi:ATP-dependent Clp protease ATP-binding subunit ClpA